MLKINYHIFCNLRQWEYLIKASLNIEYCNINTTIAGIGLINTDPLFIDILNQNFRLSSNSPCLNTGDPDPKYNDVDGSRNDMGAYGGPNGKW